MMKCQIFVDPIYGSERYVEFDPNWVIEIEEREFKLIFRRKKHSVTYIKFRNGKHFLIDGHWAERIKAAQKETATENEGSP
jgi:hypothetical protein